MQRQHSQIVYPIERQHCKLSASIAYRFLQLSRDFFLVIKKDLKLA
jgi:hypothetical protein